MNLHSLERTRLVAIRRDLHAHPELRFQEHRTSEIVANLLIESGWSVRSNVAGTGVLAAWPGEYSGPRILLRADMDAYPIQEGKSVEYASQNSGVTHACGHDIHVAVLLGLAERIKNRPDLRVAVELMFQPAEEIPYGQGSGAQAMMETGQLSQSYLAVLGLHCWPQLPAGSMGIDVGAAMAAKDAFHLTFLGKSAHVAMPATGHDAILAASTAVLTLHSSINRERNPSDLVAFNVGTFHGGQSQSVLADSAELTGTIRTHDEEVRTRLKLTVERVSRGVAAAFGLTCVITWANEMPAIQNDAQLVSLALAALPEVGIGTVRIDTPPLTSDDFALLGELGPMLYMKLGTAIGAEGSPFSLHSANFDVDEDCIEIGVTAIETLLIQILEPEKP